MGPATSADPTNEEIASFVRVCRYPFRQGYGGQANYIGPVSGRVAEIPCPYEAALEATLLAV